jgi:hypothetical protein
MKIFLPLLAFTVSCSDYDLVRDDDGTDVWQYDSAEPTGSWPDIEVFPMSLDFGTLPIDCPSNPQVVTIRNVGSETLEIESIELAGANPSSFTSDAAPPTLEPNESYEFSVSFTANAWTVQSTDIQIVSNDPNESHLALEALGEGGEDAMYDEIFYQEFYAEVDILWVIDNSCSMSGAIDQVRANFDHFIDGFLDIGLDFHIAAITTDMDDPTQSGQMQGGQTVITSADSNPRDLFLQMVDQGANGSAQEQGFGATRAALSAPLVNNENSGFLRPDAALATIIVTDEDDDTPNQNASNFSSWYMGLKSDPSKVTFSAICGDPGLGCLETTSWSNGGLISAAAGTQYLDVVAATGGSWQSICSESFEKTLEYLALSVAGMRDSWVLTETPSNIAEVVVEVDGQVVPYSGVEGWTWQTNENAIQFHGDSIPDAGATINVSYPYPSEC